MKTLFSAACALALLAHAVPAAAAVTHERKTVLDFGIGSQTQCVYFRLQGVSVADPDVMNAAYFTLSTSQTNFAEMYAVLLTARALNAPVNVTTTGTAGPCGYAAVAGIGILTP
ncbi:MAG TPA: hypothetical protein VEZ20_06985 [Allosphingosinicella sp.]|jgi:hypothetical protein|nr:hypothetical protein [Allosphingosinicella sp.]